MPDELDRHLEFLFGTDQGYIYSPIKRKNGDWIQKFFNYPADRLELIDWIVTETVENDVYLSPVLWKEKKITRDSVLHSNCVWIEFDGKAELKWDKIPEPDMIVQTSVKSHLHCYWKTAPLNIEAFEEINRRLTYYLDADTSGWDYQQVLRPPNTINYKHNLPVGQVKYHNDKPVELSVFDIAPVIEKPAEVFEYDHLLDVKDVIADNKLDQYLTAKVMSEIVIHPHRSEFLMRVGYLLAEAGLDSLEIVSCLYHIDSRIKKFVGRQDQLRRLGEIASIAEFKVERELYAAVYSPKDILTHQVNLNWIIPNLLHDTGFLIVTGQPGVGKTQFCFDMAYRMSTGGQFLNRQIVKPLRVAFLSLEMDVVELKYIFEHQCKDYPNQDLWNKNTFIISPDIEGNVASFEKTLRELKPDILFIDSISELATEDLKESEARAIVRWMKKVRKQLNLAIVAIHHDRKPGDANKKPKKLSDLYGSFIFAKSCDGVISLWQEEGRNNLEANQLKNRFGRKEEFRITRSEHLTFSTEVTVNVGNVDKPVEPIKTILNFS